MLESVLPDQVFRVKHGIRLAGRRRALI